MRALSGLLVASLFSAAGVARAEDGPPVQQDALEAWWMAAADLRIGDTAYRVDGGSLSEGVCTAQFDSGILVPIWSGKAPVSERIVGVVFLGEGSLELGFPERADAWRFANHRAMKLGEDAAGLAAVAHGDAPFRTGIDRAVLMSADPALRSLLEGLDPVGQGTVLTSGETAGEEEYVVTASRGRLRAIVTAGDLLPTRRRELTRAGLDPKSMIRQDRLLNEEFGIGGADLRYMADFRTTDRYGIASGPGAGIGGGDLDKWMTCFRDGIDQSGTGFQSMAFALGSDSEDRRHFERFSGIPFDGPPPARLLQPVSADVELLTRPQKRGALQKVDVKTTLRLRAGDVPAHHVALALPVAGETQDSWRLKSLRVVGGAEIARVGLTAGIAGATARFGGDALRTDAVAATDPVDAAAGELGASVESSEAEVQGFAAGTGGTADEGAQPDDPTVADGSRFGLNSEDPAQTDQALTRRSHRRYEVLVVLPEPVQPGEEIEIELEWSTRWLFSNWSRNGQSLGSTTGPQPFLPELIPAPTGTAWNYTARLGRPGGGLRSVDAALSGDTSREWVDDSGWIWVEARGEAARSPVVALGRWQSHNEPGTNGMPGVRVHLFGSQRSALSSFPAEVRAMVDYYDKFLPAFPVNEVEVWQGPSLLRADAVAGARPESSYGMVSVQSMRFTGVGTAGAVTDEDPHQNRSMVARQVARQYWGQQVTPATTRDEWAMQGISDAFGAFYVRSVHGNEAYEARMVALREKVEDPVERVGNEGQANRAHRFLSLSGATSMSDVPSAILRDYGFYVSADMIRLRIGDAPYFNALDRLAGGAGWGGSVSTEQLQGAFEKTSGMPLDDFFDYWVHGGFVPELTLELVETEEAGGTRYSGCVRSDVPFGRFDVPVVVFDRGGERRVAALVQVVDGQGTFEVPVREGKVDIQLDPEGFVVAYDRKVRTVKASSCVARAPEPLTDVTPTEVTPTVVTPAARAAPADPAGATVSPVDVPAVAPTVVAPASSEEVAPAP